MQDENFFVCLRLHRDDFASRGLDASSLNNDAMERIARKIGEGCMDSYWDMIDYFGEELKLPKLQQENV